MSTIHKRSQRQIRKTEKALRQMIEDEPDSIRAYVAEEALYQSYDDVADFFSDLIRNGCQSGWITSLIYYRDTHQFFDRYYDEIEELREEYEDNVGEPLSIKGDLKNWFAWFAFEETAFQLANELDLEI